MDAEGGAFSFSVSKITAAAPGMFRSLQDQKSPLLPSHHPGKFAGELVQENQQYFVYMGMEQGGTPRPDFPVFHTLLHGDILNAARDAGAEL